MAEVEYELKNYQQAEKDYKTAIYMVSNKMMSRYDLFNFYLNMKDTTNAIYWATSILNMPVKVPSPITNNIQQKIRSILKTLQ